MRLRVIQWNISNRCRPEGITGYLRPRIYAQNTIICLQEVLPRSFDALVDMLEPSCSAYSLDHRPPGMYEGINRKLGVAVLAFGAPKMGSSLIERSVFPERTIDCIIEYYDSQPVRIVSFHSLTGVDYLKAKSSNFAAIADFMAGNDDIDFACFDANEPRSDSIDPGDRVFFDNRDKGKCASLLLGKNKAHQLNDSFVDYLKKKGRAEDKNPLAISYKTQGNPRRYDHILNAQGWETENLEYQYQEALAASSDHAAVLGDFVRTAAP